MLLATPILAGAQRAPADTVRLSIAGTLPADVRQGLVMSVEESARVAGLLGRAIVLDSSATGVDRATVVLAGGIAARSDAPRGIVLALECAAPPTLAAARWFSLCPTAAGAGPPAADSIVGWDPALEKYGASQLNDRYRARWDAPMTDGAWRGWLAAKIAWESALRGPRDPAALAHWLASPAARFDGHQGVPLSFDARHRLRHPRYRVLHRGSTRTIEALP
jgi:hypothetical protein